MVEWYEGAVERLSGPHLLRNTNDTNPTHYVRRHLTAAPSIPIATLELEVADAQGSVTLFFHENKDRHGATSTKVFGVSNSARIPPSSPSSRALVYLPSMFDSLDSVDFSAVSTRSRPAPVATEQIPTSWSGGLLS